MSAAIATPSPFATHLRRFKHLLIREVIEHRTGIILAPMVVAGLMAAAFLIIALLNWQQLYMLGDHGFHNMRIEFINGTPEEKAQAATALGMGLMGLSVPLLVICGFVSFFILLSALYDERQERSVLFWKSMPVSDTATVLSKLVVAIIVTPLVALGVGIALQVYAWVLVSIVAAAHGFPIVGALWTETPILSIWLSSIIRVLHYGLWALPVMSWVLLASAIAPRAPLMIAAVPVAAIALMEGLFLKSSHFIEEVFFRLTGLATHADLADKLEHGHGDEVQTLQEALISPLSGLGQIGHSFAMPGLWIGFAVAAAFIYAAIEIRRRKTL